MTLDVSMLDRIVGRPVDRSNAASLLAGLAARQLGSARRLAMFCGQVLHESGGLRWDGEIWGPSAAQRGYEGRADLGNTQPGDGFRFRGRGPIQITGRANYRAFTAWCRTNIRPDAPDFEADPEAIRTDPWEGLGPIWYFEAAPGLLGYCDAGNIEMATRRINGGLNGYDDRLRLYVRSSLVLLGRDPDDVVGFQRAAGLTPDGIAGPATRAALHSALGQVAASSAQPAPTPAPAAPAASPSILASILAAIAALFRRS